MYDIVPKMPNAETIVIFLYLELIFDLFHLKYKFKNKYQMLQIKERTFQFGEFIANLHIKLIPTVSSLTQYLSILHTIFTYKLSFQHK